MVNAALAGQPLAVPIPTHSQMPPLKQLFKEGWNLFKLKLRVSIKILLAPYLAGLVIFIIMWQLGYTEGFMQPSQQGGLYPRFDLGVGGYVAWGLAILAFIFVYIWSQASVIYAVVKPNANVGVRESYAVGFRKMMPLLWIGIITGLAVLGGLVLLIIPGIIFAIWYSFASYILFTEDKRGVAALQASRYYVKGNLGRVFGRGIVIGLCLIVFSIVVDLIGNIFTDADSMASGIIDMVYYLFATPFAAAMFFKLFEHTKALKPAADQSNLGRKRGIIGFATFGLIVLIIVPILIISLVISEMKSRANDLLQRNDQLSDITFLALFEMSLDSYGTEKGAYPNSLDQLAPDYLFEVPVHRSTNKPYVYTVKNNGQSYTLCEPTEPVQDRRCVSGSLDN